MKYIVLTLVSIFLVTIGNAQNLLNSKSPEEFKSKDSLQIQKIANGELAPEDKPIKYVEVADKDIIWSKLVWEVLDLEDQINQPYKVNVNGVVNSKTSLYNALIMGMEMSSITEVYEDDKFSIKLDKTKLLDRSKVRILSEDGKKWQNANPGVSVPDKFYDEYVIDNDQVTRFKILGMWYMDKRIGELKYRLLGIAPMGPDVNVLAESGEKDYVDLFWVWYAGARETLHQFKIFNPANSASKISFDDVLTARRFSSVIYKLENKNDETFTRIYSDDPDDQIEAALRFKEELVSREGDMWAY